MKAKLRILNTVALVSVVLVLLFANIRMARAHNWDNYHWDRCGNPTVIRVWNFAVRFAEAEAALNDWDNNTILSLPRQNSHTDISVFDGNYGATGWSGLCSLEDLDFGWWDCWTWCHIAHAHSRVNTFYTGTPAGFSTNIQGIFCQEIGHAFGLDHSNTGDCMGKTYYNNINVTGPHNWSDINKYLCGGTHP